MLSCLCVFGNLVDQEDIKFSATRYDGGAMMLQVGMIEGQDSQHLIFAGVVPENGWQKQGR